MERFAGNGRYNRNVEGRDRTSIALTSLCRLPARFHHPVRGPPPSSSPFFPLQSRDQRANERTSARLTTWSVASSFPSFHGTARYRVR